jgi:hypothetical protein
MFALAAMRHRRLIPFFVLVAAAYVPGVIGQSLTKSLTIPIGCLAVGAAYFHYFLPLPLPFFVVRPGFPEGAVRYLKREEPALGKLRLYNPWGWGGYIGYRLFPSYPVFQNGYSVFYDLLVEGRNATDKPEHWQNFLGKQRLDLAIMNADLAPLQVTYRHADGSTHNENRPYYIYFMPQAQWALVYWDSVAQIFIRRGTVPRSWLDRHEYSFLHPGDLTALQRMIASRNNAMNRLHSEICRHLNDSGPDPEADLLWPSAKRAEHCASAP